MPSDIIRLPSLEPGMRIGPCAIVRPLGKGGMGEVFLAMHLRLNRLVAIKVLPPGWGRQSAVDRFLNEAQLCSRIDHPHVIAVHDVGVDQGLYFIVMQYVDGLTLAELARQQGGRLDPLATLKVIRPVAMGLHAVHMKHMVHRDVKPGNIMLRSDGRVFLMDFGLVDGMSDDGLSGPAYIAGTPAFMSPEQCRGEPLDGRSDVFALGGALYNLVTGCVPYEGRREDLLKRIGEGERPPLAHFLNRSIPMEVSGLVAKAMAFRRRDRFASAQQMALELGRLIKQHATCETAAWGADSDGTQTSVPRSQITRSAISRPPGRQAADVDFAGPPLVILPARAASVRKPQRLSSRARTVLAAACFVALVAAGLVLASLLQKEGSSPATTSPPRTSRPDMMVVPRNGNRFENRLRLQWSRGGRNFSPLGGVCVHKTCAHWRSIAGSSGTGLVEKA